jgi:hypothetical protein
VIEADAVRATRRTLVALAPLGFDEIAIEPPWHDLDASRRTIVELATALA